MLLDHCLVKLTFTGHGSKAWPSLLYIVRLLYHYHQWFIEIKRENLDLLSIFMLIPHDVIKHANLPWMI